MAPWARRGGGARRCAGGRGAGVLGCRLLCKAPWYGLGRVAAAGRCCRRGSRAGAAFCVCVFWGCRSTSSSSLPLSSAFGSSAAKRRQPPLASRPSRCGDRTRAGHREPLTRGTRCPRGRPAGLAARSAPALCLPNRRKRVSGSGSRAAVPRLPRLCRCVLHHRHGGEALAVPDAVAAEALAVGAGLLRPSLPGSWSLHPPQDAAPARLAPGLAAADGLNPWRDLKMSHAGTHQTASPLLETLFPARSALISVQEETSLFAS